MNVIETDLPPHDPEGVAASLDVPVSTHPPRILVLYGSLRERSFSRLLSEECGRALTDGLPLFDRQSHQHPEVRKLRELSIWLEGQVWVSPEQHGSMTAVFKNQIDWLPLSDGAA